MVAGFKLDAGAAFAFEARRRLAMASAARHNDSERRVCGLAAELLGMAAGHGCWARLLGTAAEHGC